MRRLNINKNFLFSAGKTFQDIAMDVAARLDYKSCCALNKEESTWLFDIWKFFI